MAKFVYRMQSILDIKLKMENQAKLPMDLRMQNLRKNRKSYRILSSAGRDMRKKRENSSVEPSAYRISKNVNARLTQ